MATMTQVRERPKARTSDQAEKMAFTIGRIGVIGAGQMGNGIAHVAALAGMDVLLNDISADRINAGLATINGNLTRQVSRKLISEEDRKAALARIAPADTLDKLGNCDLIIESASEKEEVKRKIFTDLCPSLKADAILGSNTSSISITRLASSTDRPEKFIGIHFMNPVPVMELVELIRGIATDDMTFDATRQFVTKLGKTIAVAEDFPAFIVNRILLPMINEAIYTLYEGVGNVEAIDTAMRLGAHHPMGPLELADFIGLDTCLSVMQVLHEGLADSKYRPCPLLVKYVEAGWLGRKTQRGFLGVEHRRGDGKVGNRERIADEIFLLCQMCVEHSGFLLVSGDTFCNGGLVGWPEIENFLDQPFRQHRCPYITIPVRQIPALPARDIGADPGIVGPQRVRFFARDILHDRERFPESELDVEQSQRAAARV